VEAAQSRDLPDFLEQFCVAFDANAWMPPGEGVAVYRGRETETSNAMPGSSGTTNGSGLQTGLILRAREQARTMWETRAIPKGRSAAGIGPFLKSPGTIVFVSESRRTTMKGLETICLNPDRKRLGWRMRRNDYCTRWRESCGALAGENFPAILATGAVQTAMGGRHRRDQRFTS